MKKILLVLRHNKDQFDKDTKYKGISKAFQRFGFEVYRTYFEDKKIILINGENKEEIANFKIGFRGFNRNTLLYRSVDKLIKNRYFDLCYIRAIPTTLDYLKMVRNISLSKTKILVEIPTYPIHGELKTDLIHRRIIRNILIFIEKLSIKYISLYLLIGESSNNYLGCPAINIENGVDITLYNTKRWISHESFHMLFIGKIARWHGIERLIIGMANYYQSNPQQLAYLHIIGSDADGSLKNYKKLVDKHNLNQYVIFEGSKYCEEADGLFDLADIAIASLGDHRRGMNNISLLKIKEYMARGIPFIYSTKDNMLENSWDFCFKVPSDESPIDINRLIDFSNSINHSDVSQRMRNICEKKMGWNNQISKILEFINS